MRNELRSYFYNVTNFLDKKKYISLSLGIVLLGIYRIIDTNNDFGIDYNLIFDLNNKYYIIMQLLLTSFFTIGFLHEFKSKVEMITRFKTRREYFRYIVKHISFLVLVIFTVNLSVLFILRLFKHHFTFSCEEYLLYKMPTVLYFTWQIFRNLIYMLFMSYVVSSLYFFVENKRIVYSIFGVLILALFFQNVNLVEFAPLEAMFFSTFLSYYDFNGFEGEISCFICSFIVKFYVLKLFVFIARKWKSYAKK